MSADWLSVEQVANRLGLHVRTVRGYIRAGRLQAVRIGKQYRIAAADLDAFTGRPAPTAPATTAPATTAPATTAPATTAPATNRVSTVVDVDGIDAARADRLGTLLVAGAQTAHAAPHLHVRAIHDDTRAHLSVVIVGDLRATAAVLHTIDDLLGPAFRADQPVAHRG